MNLRHAAVLTLVVWYLMTPPPLAMNPNKPDLSIPPAKWVAREEMNTQSNVREAEKEGNFACA